MEYVLGSLASIFSAYYGKYDEHERTIKIVLDPDLDGICHTYYWWNSYQLLSKLKRLHNENINNGVSRQSLCNKYDEYKSVENFNEPNHLFQHFLSKVTPIYDKLEGKLSSMILLLNYIWTQFRTNMFHKLEPAEFKQNVNLAFDFVIKYAKQNQDFIVLS